jgi:hypothetical protein
MLVLFDQGTPSPIRHFLEGHTVKTAWKQGWHELTNGQLLTAAEEAGFQVLVTTDKNIRHQQNLTVRTIAVVVLGSGQWPELRPHIRVIVDAVNTATAGRYIEVRVG